MCKYDYSAPVFSEGTGHFTQMVWAGTTAVGCAMTGPETCPKGFLDPRSGRTWPHAYMLVCEYDKPGNYAGRFAANVLPPIVQPAKCSK